MKKYDVVALGELLVDFTENGISGQGIAVFCMSFGSYTFLQYISN